MNYESDAMTAGELVDATYEAGLGLNRVKAKVGIIDQATADQTETRAVAARQAMAEIDKIMTGDPTVREARLFALKKQVDELSESTVCEKTELNWPAYVSWRHVYHVLVLWVGENLANLFRLRRHAPHSASETSEAR